jgi:hypothetical protein
MGELWSIYEVAIARPRDSLMPAYTSISYDFERVINFRLI